MRYTLLTIAYLCLTNTIQAGVVVGPFHVSYWSADGILIGRVEATGEMTLDVDVESWLRDRTESRPLRIRAFRYIRPSCAPIPPESYKVGSCYLFLMRQPYDEGAGGNPHWIVILQHQLDGGSVCLDNLDVSLVEKVRDGCRRAVTEELFIDALRSVDTCFRFTDDKNLGSFPSKQVCSEDELKAWSARSAMHLMLIKTASDRLAQKRGE